MNLIEQAKRLVELAGDCSGDECAPECDAIICDSAPSIASAMLELVEVVRDVDRACIDPIKVSIKPLRYVDCADCANCRATALLERLEKE